MLLTWLSSITSTGLTNGFGQMVLGRARLQPCRYKPHKHWALAPEGRTACSTNTDETSLYFYFTTAPEPVPNLPQYSAEKQGRMAIRATRQPEMQPKAGAPGVTSLPESRSTLPA
jgi:hypothetical protein